MAEKTPPAEMQAQIARFVPGALNRAIKSYENYSKGKEKEVLDKGFSDFHKGGRLAITHIQLLYKLACDVGIENEDTQRAEELLRSESLAIVNDYHCRTDR